MGLASAPLLHPGPPGGPRPLPSRAISGSLLKVKRGCKSRVGDTGLGCPSQPAARSDHRACLSRQAEDSGPCPAAWVGAGVPATGVSAENAPPGGYCPFTLTINSSWREEPTINSPRPLTPAAAHMGRTPPHWSRTHLLHSAARREACTRRPAALCRGRPYTPQGPPRARAGRGCCFHPLIGHSSGPRGQAVWSHVALPSLLGLAQSPGPEEQAPVVCSPASHSGRASLTPSFLSVEQATRHLPG